MTRARFGAQWTATTATIVVSLVWLHTIGTGDLAAPPMAPAEFLSWLERTDVAVAMFALLRLVAMMMGLYLLGIAMLTGVARACAFARLETLAHQVTLPFLRGAFGTIALLGVMTAPPDTTTPPQTSTEDVTLHLLREESPETAPRTPPPATQDPAPRADESFWTVQHGECFWSIAREHLVDVTGHDVTDQEVATYWREVIETNRSRLVNPRDPDLLFSGQVLELPAVAPG